jgi:hypothetical protein
MNPSDDLGVNRGEFLRALPADDTRYAEHYNRRQRAESINNWIKDQLPLHRARTYGQTNQHLDLIFLAVARNITSELHHRDRTANAPPGAAAA